jgi:hypothetical protein
MVERLRLVIWEEGGSQRKRDVEMEDRDALTLFTTITKRKQKGVG